MEHSKRPFKEAFHHGSTPLGSSVKKAKPTAASAPVVSPAQFNSFPLPAGEILLSTSPVTASQPPTDVGPDLGPQPEGDLKIQTIASNSEGTESTTALPGEPLPSGSTQTQLPLQATAGGQFAAAVNASIGAPQGSLGSNSMETPPSNLIQPSLPLQISGEAQLPTGGHINVVAHASTLGSNLAGKFFENASNFSVNNPIMGENIQVTHVQMSSGAVLEKMVERIIPGAQYDSSARDSPPHCHPGTRTQILEDVQDRIHNPDLATRVVWIYGPAGVGKSAIMQTLTEAEASRGGIFTTLFFSRPNERNDPTKVFTTLAYSLAVHNLEYRRYIGHRLESDPMFLAKRLDDQFQQLFVTPFLTPFTKDHINFTSQRWVIFLDGLDECRGEAEQRRIVELIRRSMLHCAMSTPFIWIIASRPEAHLKMEFARVVADVTSFWELEVPIDSVDSLRDVERYLHTQFSKMRESHSTSIPPLWPSESDFLKVSDASSGLFIFASTLVAYLLGGDPVSRLKYIILLIVEARTQTVDPKRNPFRLLDLLYRQIMSDVPEEILSTTKLLLGFYLSPLSADLPLLLASNILSLEQYEVYAALRKLQSALDFPSSQEAGNRLIRFLHASFSDFLLDPTRSRTYFIDLNEEASRIWGCCSGVLRRYETHYRSTCINLTWSPSGANSAALQENVFQAACEILTLAILNYRRETTKGAPFTDNASLLKLLQNLGASIFRQSKEKIGSAVDLLDWLPHHAPPEVGLKFIKTFPLRDLNINQLFKSLCAQRWCYHLVSQRKSSSDHLFHDVDLSALAGFGASEWRQAQDALWNKSSVFGGIVEPSNSPIAVRQLGFKGTRQCVVIGPIYTGHSPGVSFLILPYFDEQAES